ncbi:hypothetical protein ACHAXT_011179 [Thalassiosira profunda]
MVSYLLPSLLLSLAPTLAGAASAEAERQVEAILQRMETDVLAFRDEMERAYSLRCDAATLTECSESNFNDCSSTYPGQQCMQADELVISRCGDGTACNGLWSKEETAVRIPESLVDASGNPEDQEVIESVCYSRLADPYMVDNYSLGNQMYFGSRTGAFRIVPARQSETCGAYDPRRRPWYVAASSGPKDVVLTIDTSGSMLDYNRLELAKDAAKTVVDTLTVADRVAIVAFSDTASMVGGHTSLIRATKENKSALMQAIDGLSAKGATNFHDGFKVTFDALETTIRNEATTGCNIAVLFLTDGESTTGPGNDDTIKLVNERTEQLSATWDRDTTVFTFSLGQQADHDVTKQIACSTGGLWTPVDDFDEDLVTAMSSYYMLYAMGLGEGGNEDFTAWVEPYTFYTAGKKGTSVSTPVYDRSVDPPLFLGAATVDMYLDDLEELLGEDASSSKMLERFVILSTARCPTIELTEIERDALRYLGGGEAAVCGASNFTSSSSAGIILPEKCFQSDWPKTLWENEDYDGKDYEDRACCAIGSTVPSDVCPDETAVALVSESSNAGLIVGVSVAVGVAVGLLVFVVCKMKTSKKEQKQMRMQSSIDVQMTVMPPPSAPGFVGEEPAPKYDEANAIRAI